MAGSKTRFGFAGDGSEPPDGDDARSARTVLGHDIHLRLPSGFEAPKPPGPPAPLPPAPPPRTPSPPVRLPQPEQETDESFAPRPTFRPRPSRLARFLGRWTGGGHFESNRRMGNESEVDFELPRDPTGRNVMLVLLVAVVAFLVTFAIVRMRQHAAARSAEAREPASAVVPSAPAAPTPPAPNAAPTAPLPPPVPIPAKPAQLPPEPIPAAAKGLGAGVRPAPTPARKPAPAIKYVAEPPEHLKEELLPIKR